MENSTKKPFIQHFREILLARQSTVCVGIDPEVTKLPSPLPRNLHGLEKFCQEIIAATAPYAASFKINFAFFEAHGHAGWAALERVIAMIPDRFIRIADAKRGDIGNTARLYAQSVFQDLPFDCMTVNPYLGDDAAGPFLEDETKGIFFLCRTSNPGSKTIQYYPTAESQSIGSQPLYLHIAKQIKSWNKKKNCGLVVGATQAVELEKVRTICPNLPLLIPGIGAQGGDLEAAVQHGVTKQGDLAVINASRSIIYASSGSNFAEAAAERAAALRDQIKEIINE